MTAALSGFLLGLGLILAIGAQNALVLRQGLRGAHVFAVCLFCSVSDAALITLGVVGVGAAAMADPLVAVSLRYSGAAFIAGYGVLRLWAAYKGEGDVLTPDAGAAASTPQSLWSVLGACAAFTWLNPHVYLDTVGLVGAASAQWIGPERFWFGVGAVTASFAFFFSLGYGAALLRPVLASPQAWRVVDVLIGVVMLLLAAKLAFG